MGFRCPVCGDPQADDVHLANHIAFTAVVRGGEHEEWLDEHVPDWGQLDDEGLAAKVSEFATETEYPHVFEDTSVDEHAHADEHGGRSEGIPDANPGALRSGAAALSDDEFEEILDEARRLTEKRRSDGESPEKQDEDNS